MVPEPELKFYMPHKGMLRLTPLVYRLKGISVVNRQVGPNKGLGKRHIGRIGEDDWLLLRRCMEVMFVFSPAVVWLGLVVVVATGLLGVIVHCQSPALKVLRGVRRLQWFDTAEPSD